LDLIGTKEVDLTAFFALTLKRSSIFASKFLSVIGSQHHQIEALHLEVNNAEHQGRTDLELSLGDDLVIIEVKKGWVSPSREQLEKYQPRLPKTPGSMLVSVSAMSEDFFLAESRRVGSPVQQHHSSWKTILKLAHDSRQSAAGSEKRALDDYIYYLEKVMPPRTGTDAWTFNVVLSNDLFGDFTFRQYVEDEGVYFHSHGGTQKGWPTTPPSFFSYRWDGHTRLVRRVESATPVTSLLGRWPTIPEVIGDQPHVVYELGPKIYLPEPLPNGAIWPSGRYRVLLDQLFTAKDLKEAIDYSHKIDEELL
jgi:hypothetical protein